MKTLMTAAQRRADGRQRGTLLVPSLLLIVPIAALTGSTLLLSHRGVQSGLSTAQRDKALLLAETGVDRLLGTVTLGPVTSGTLEGSYGGGSYAVTYTRGDLDELDNDGDDTTDESDEQSFYLVRSTGRVSGAEAAIETMLRRNVVQLNVQAAIQITDPHPEVDLNGNSFRIGGDDKNIDGTAGSAAAVPGIGTAGTAAEVQDQINSNRWDQITGMGGDPSIHHVDPFDPHNFAEQIEQIASLRLTNPGTYTGSLGDAEASDFRITYVQGDIHISGGATGAGVLVVNGDLTITGGWEFIGYLLVLGKVRFGGGGSGVRVYGGVVVSEEVEQLGDPEEELELAGTIDVHYSSQGLTMAQNAFTNYSMVLWRNVGWVEP